MGGEASKPEQTQSVFGNVRNYEQRAKEDPEKFKEFVQGNKIMIFSATYCSYCNIVKKQFDDLGTKFTAVEVNKEEDGPMLMDVITSVTGSRMVPQIFICGQTIPGGSAGLKHLQDSGQLTDVLKACC